MPILAKKTEKNESNAVALQRKRKWPYAVGTAVLLLTVIVVAGKVQGSTPKVIISPTDTSVLIRTDLQDTVSATGTVESAQSMTVYSTKAYTVQEVLVEVGDRVEDGQLLCKLDDRNIQNQIESQQASLNAATNASNASIASAKDNYEQFKKNLEAGLNTSIISAENAVTNAYNAYLNAQDTYDRYLAGLNAGENTTLLTQEASLRNARNSVKSAYDSYEDGVDGLAEAEDALADAEEALEDAEEQQKRAKRSRNNANYDLEAAKEGLENAEKQAEVLQTQIAACVDALQKLELQSQLAAVQTEAAQLTAQIPALETAALQAETAYNNAAASVTQAELTVEQCEKAREKAADAIEACADAIANAEAAYETAQKQYNAALTSADNLLADYAKNVETTLAAYEKAKTSLTAAKTAAENQLQTYKNNLNSAYANANKSTSEVSLRQLQTDLESTQITAPMTGTVTAVYAEVGSSGSGLLFVIEDTENFVIATTVKDYDIATVGVGTAASIRSDATGDDLYTGEVTYIAPTANKNAMGVTDTSGDIAFDTDVAVRSADTKLRIGLNVRLSFIVAEEKGALAAPYDAVYTNAQGQTCVLAAEGQPDGTWLLREIAVETGLETDLDISVKGGTLTEGMTVVCSPEQYVQYIGQPVQIGSGGEKAWFGGV